MDQLRFKGADRMKTALSLISAFALSTASLAEPQTCVPNSAYQSVDPFIGTGGEGHIFPGAVAPFGMVQLSPDTNTSCKIRECYGWAAGYRYDDTSITGFSHTHFSGAGHSDLGDVLLMPAAGDTMALEPGDIDKPGTGYRSRFSHTTEVATPGYYAVTLADPGIRAELTAGTRVGVHRYGFPLASAAHLIVDLRSSIYNYPGKTLWSSIRILPDGTITGVLETRGWAPARKVFFAMRFSAHMTAHAFLNREEYFPYKGFRGRGAATRAWTRYPAVGSSPGSISAH